MFYPWYFKCDPIWDSFEPTSEDLCLYRGWSFKRKTNARTQGYRASKLVTEQKTMAPKKGENLETDLLSMKESIR
jgi:hypothetical protein